MPNPERVIMKRVLEPELMTNSEQARAYAQADFEEAHNSFVRTFGEKFTGEITGFVLDIGCGPGDVTTRFARAYPGCTVHGIDGSPAMLRCGREILAGLDDLRDRIELFEARLPEGEPPQAAYDAVISNSLLHHLPDPRVLWESVGRYARPEAPVFVMDLMRPVSVGEAQRLVELYSSGEPEVLRRDFFNSLLAAFEPGEIKEQLEQSDLDHLDIEVISDRHVIVFGRR